MVSSLPPPPSDAESGWDEVYDEFVARLKALGVGDGAPRQGELFPNLVLPDARGTYRAVHDLLDGRPLVVSFLRGSWCPFCRHEVEAWSQALAPLSAAGGRLLIICGELGDGVRALRARAGEDALLLCDVDHGAALACALACHIGDDLKQRYLDCGLDLAEVYGSDGAFVPVPATFVLDASGRIAHAFVDADFRRRADPAEIVSLVQAMA